MSVKSLLFDMAADLARAQAAAISPEYRRFRDQLRTCDCAHEDGWDGPVPPVCDAFIPDDVTPYCGRCEHNRSCHK